MKWSVLITFAFLCKVQQSHGDKLALVVNCNYTENEALIKYTGDAYGVLAINDNGDQFWFKEDVSSASFQIEALFPPSSKSKCKFDKGDAALEIFTISVEVRKTFKHFESGDDEFYTVECNFENFKTNVKGSVKVRSPILLPTVVQQSLGEESQSSIDVKIVKMDGTDFSGAVDLGRLVKLKALMTPAAETEVGFRATNCYVSTDDDTKTNIVLVDGCGTGSPFKQGKGLVTSGVQALSPVFQMFRIKRGQGIAFKCDFVVCLQNCDGSSCAAEAAEKRKKRESPKTVPHASETKNRQKRDLFDKYKHAIGEKPAVVSASVDGLPFYLDTQSEIAPLNIPSPGRRVVTGKPLRVSLIDDKDQRDVKPKNASVSKLKKSGVQKMSSTYQQKSDPLNKQKTKSEVPAKTADIMASDPLNEQKAKSKVPAKTADIMASDPLNEQKAKSKIPAKTADIMVSDPLNEQKAKSKVPAKTADIMASDPFNEQKAKSKVPAKTADIMVSDPLNEQKAKSKVPAKTADIMVSHKSQVTESQKSISNVREKSADDKNANKKSQSTTSSKVSKDGMKEKSRLETKQKSDSYSGSLPHPSDKSKKNENTKAKIKSEKTNQEDKFIIDAILTTEQQTSLEQKAKNLKDYIKRQLMNVKFNTMAFAALATSCIIGLIVFVILILRIVLRWRHTKKCVTVEPTVSQVEPTKY